MLRLPRLPFSRTVEDIVSKKLVKRNLARSGWNFDKHFNIYLQEQSAWLRDYLPIDFMV